MRVSLRLKALSLRAAAAALIAALLGALLQLSPQPLTDQLLRWELVPVDQDPVILVVMEADATPGAWIRMAAQLKERGVAAIGLVGRDLPAVAGVEQLQRADTAQGESGFPADWDGRHRNWIPRIGEINSFPARLLLAADRPIPLQGQRIPLGRRGVPTLDQGQVTGLSTAALEGRIAVLGTTDPWSTPVLSTPGAAQPLAEAVARVIGGPGLPLLSNTGAAFWAGLLALATTLSLLLLRTSAARYSLLAGSCVAVGLTSAGLLRLGLVVPVEVLLAGLFSAGFTWRATTWQNAELQLQRLQDNLLTRLGEGLGTSDTGPEATWGEICRAAVSWGGTDAAWAFGRSRQGLVERSRAGEVDDVISEELRELVTARVHANLTEPLELPPLAPPGQPGSGQLVAIPMRARHRSLGLLVARLSPPQAPDHAPDLQAHDWNSATRRNLQIFATHAAQRLLRARSRASLRAVAAEPGIRARLHELASSLEHLLDQRDLLLAGMREARTAHGLYDPLGHPLLLDDSFRRLLDRLKLPPESLLPAVWSGLDMPQHLLLQTFGGRGPLRHSVDLPGMGLDCWIYPCGYQNRILGVGIELVDVSELQAQDTVKSGLLEMVSYRVHNILAAIRGYADLLSLGAVDSSEVAPRIAARCGEMAEIFARYEDVASSSEGAQAEPIQVIDLLQDVVAGARRTLGEHRVRLVNTPMALAPALADRRDLARALMGLIHDMAGDTTADQAVLVELHAPAGIVEILLCAEGHAPPLHVLQQLAADSRDQGAALARRLVQTMGARFMVEGGGEQGARYRIQLREA